MIKPKKIIYDKTKSVEVENNYIVDNYISKDEKIGYSVVRTHLNGKHPYMKNINSNRTYYLLNGNADFYIDDDIIKVSTGEMMIIPKDTKYAFKGEFDAILIDCPAFDAKYDIIYDEQIID